MTDRSKDVPPSSASRSAPASVVSARSLKELDPVAHGLDLAREYLASHQAADGAWSSTLSSSRSVTARVILLHYWLARFDTAAVQQSFESLIQSQNSDGGWSNVPGKPSDLSTTTLVYLVLRISGHSHEGPQLTKARAAIERLGGVGNCDGLSHFYLALFGQLSYDHCPNYAPECFLLPWWMPWSLPRKSRWVQNLFVPLSVLWAQRPYKVLTQQQSIQELFTRPMSTRGFLTRSAVSHSMARLERWRLRPFRKYALERAEQWIVERITEPDGLCGSMDATILAVIALVCRGYGQSSEPVQRALAAVTSALVLAENSGQFVEFAGSRTAVYDTALAVRALARGSASQESAAIRNGIEYLLRCQSSGSESGVETSRKPPATAPEGQPPEGGQNGWCREFKHSQPSIAATATVLLALREQFAEKPPSSLVTDDSMVAMIRANSLNAAHHQIAMLDRVAAASRRGRHWVIALQNQDGGWGHVSRMSGVDNSRWQLSRCWPERDGSTVAATGRVLKALGAWEMGCGQTAVDRAVSFLRGKQLDNGMWPGSHDASPIEATWAAIDGLRAVGLPRRDSTLARAAEWLLISKQPAGGWSDEEDGSPSPLATAWAVMGLVATGHRESIVAQQGVRYLVEKQHANGSWPLEVAALRELNPNVAARTWLAATTYPTMALAVYLRQSKP